MTLYAFPDSLVACDSHTPMINSLGVMGWGVGGIEAASAMLGEPHFDGDSGRRRLPSGGQIAGPA